MLEQLHQLLLMLFLFQNLSEPDKTIEHTTYLLHVLSAGVQFLQAIPYKTQLVSSYPN
jgi:hypothetical protein